MIDVIATRLSRVSSTRSAALLRIGLALLLWTRFGMFWVPFHFTIEPWRLFTAANFWIATTRLLIGFQTRLASVWTAVVLVVSYYVFGVFGDGQLADLVHHHTLALILATAWLPFTSCGRSLSLDRYLEVRRAVRGGDPIPEERAPDWGLLLVALQATSIYWWGAWDKTGWHFLSGERLDIMFMHAYTGFRVPGTAWAVFVTVAAWVTVLVEYALPVGLAARRTQPVATLVGVGLHAAIYLALPVSTFSVTMVLLYLAFYHPDDVHRVIETLLGRPGWSPPPDEPRAPASRPGT